MNQPPVVPPTACVGKNFIKAWLDASTAFVFTMVGGEQTRDNNPKGFNECVSQEQLQAVVEDAQKG